MDDLDLGATIKGFSPGQKVFSRYTLKKILGRGGMGVVWLAHDGELERDVALKFLPEVVAMDKQSILELKRETRRSLELTHPHIVRIHDFVQDGRTAAISMEYVAGDSLAALKIDQPGHRYSPEQLAKWVRQLCEALDYAHQKAEVVHRDLKPANLMIDARGDLKIADFGIAASVSDSVSRVSAQGGSSGTPVYMSPQQMMGEKPAVTDDVYSLGATLYDLLTGKPPFHSGNVIAQVQSKVPPTVSDRRRELASGEGEAGEPVIPDVWEQTIAACLAKEAGDRPLTAREVAHRLGFGSASTTAPFSTPPMPSRPGVAAARKPAAPASPAPAAGKKPAVLAGVIAAVLLAGGLGYYFGVYAPAEQRAAEQARLVAEQKKAAELKAEQERQAEAARLAEVQRLANLRLTGRISTDPVGAEVRIEPDISGLSPLVRHDLKLGEHTVRIRQEGYEDQVEKITVTEKGANEWGYKLVRSTGALALAALPAGPATYQIRQAGTGAVNGPAVLAEGNLPAEVKLPTGRYEFRAGRPGWGGTFSRVVEVRRNESVPLQADLRGGSFTVRSNPAGAAVYRAGQNIGLTPLTVDDVPFNQPVELEVWLDRYQPAKRVLTIADADHPQAWDATLQLKPLLPVKPDFTKGAARLRTTVRNKMQGSAQSQTGTAITPLPATDFQYETSSVYEMSAPGRDGQWGGASAYFESQTGTLPDDYRVKPGTVVRFQRNLGNEWTGQYAAGGAVNGNQPAAFTSSNVALWLSGDVWPPPEALAGATWEVPLRAAPGLLPFARFKNPQGSIRGRLVSFDREAAQPWADLEYSFELDGDIEMQDQEVPKGMSATGSGSARGTLRLRVEVAGGYVSHALLNYNGRTKARYIPLAGGSATGGPVAAVPMARRTIALAALEAAELAKTAAASAGTESVATYESTLEISAVPYDGPVANNISAPVVAKVPVYFYRQNNILVGIAAHVGLRIGGRDYPAVKDGSYLVAELPPGPVAVTTGHVVSGRPWRQAESTITIRPGGPNYFEVSLSNQMIFERPAATGQAYVARLRLQADLRGGGK